MSEPLLALASEPLQAPRDGARKMTMQRRHFELIAKTLKELDYKFPGGRFDDEHRRCVATHFAAKLRSTNPNFNEARFLRACGVEG